MSYVLDAAGVFVTMVDDVDLHKEFEVYEGSLSRNYHYFEFSFLRGCP
jgi:hypothetical protein